MPNKVIRVWVEYQDEHGENYMTPVPSGRCVCSLFSREDEEKADKSISSLIAAYQMS